MPSHRVACLFLFLYLFRFPPIPPMSIAVSAFVRPSRTARLLLLGWSLAQCAAAAAVGLAPARFGAAPWLAALLGGAGLILARAAALAPKTHRIDISGTGELRVTVQQDVRAPRPVQEVGGGAAGGADEAPLALLPGSVLWPGLMVLRLGGQEHRHTRPQMLAIWRDSVDGDAWRALAVALGVIGRPGRAQDGFEKNR